MDGSGTRDPNGDSLSYQWALVSAPPGSAVTVNANTPSFVFRPDAPGEYELQLTASDGFTSGTDKVRVSAEMLFKISTPGKFSIDGSSGAGSDQLDLKIKTSARHSGTPVTFTASSNVAWLVAPASGTLERAGRDTVVPLRLNLQELKGMANGKHEARVTVAPNGGWTGDAADVTLDLALPLVRVVAPYVAYVNEPSRVTLIGEKLRKADGKSLFIGGAEALAINATSDSRATVDLPPLPGGTYTVRIGHALDVAREMGRVVVRTPPVYRDFDRIPFDGPLQAFEYDAERDAIYYVVLTKGEGLYFGLVLRNDGSGGWAGGALPISPPNFEARALALTPDGTQLLVTSRGCMVHRLNADTLAVLETVQKACAEGSEFTGIAPLADGRVLVIQDNPGSNSEVLEYPGFAPTDVLPGRSDSFLVLNSGRDRLLYVEPGGRTSESTTIDAKTDVYDIDGQSRSVQFQEDRWEVWPQNLSMTADGSRTLHATGVYDRQLNLIGRLAGVDWVRPGSALNAQGTRAVALEGALDGITVHDLTGPGPLFPQVGAPMFLPEDVVGIPRLFVPQSGGAVFAVVLADDAGPGSYQFYVRVNPALTR
jgi:hypothetical protein